jgi:hypothetical protein
MERERRFRAWNKKEKVMYYDVQCAGYSAITKRSGDGFVACCSPKGSFYEFFLDKDYEVMDYAGLYDKNKKPIFEGDILIDNEYPEEGIGYGTVEWYDYGWTVEPWFTNKEFKEAENYEIIGNIYEDTVPGVLSASQREEADQAYFQNCSRCKGGE